MFPIYILLLLSPFVLSHLVTSVAWEIQTSRKKGGEALATVPYAIPLIGSALSIWLKPWDFIRSATQFASREAVYYLKVLNYHLCFVQGPKNVAAIWKCKAHISTTAHQVFVLDTVLGMDPKAVDIYRQDDTGMHLKPQPGSNSVLAHNRVDYLTHVGFHKLLVGEDLPKLFDRWSSSFLSRLATLPMSDEWMASPDIMDFWALPLTASLNEALAGPLLECLNPDFNRQFLTFSSHATSMMRGLPRWVIPKAYAARDQLVRTARQWQSIARAQSSSSATELDDDADPWWGSRFFRERQKTLSRLDCWDETAVAISDFGFLWGAGVNVHTAATWTIIEVFKDKSLLSKVRAELSEASFQGNITSIGNERLLELPLLQSIYAEVLRLRVEVQTMFVNHQEAISINGWRIPKKTTMIVPTYPAHMDRQFWNTQNGLHPLDTFWAERFLVYPNDPTSGPRLNPETRTRSAPSPHSSTASGKPKFAGNGMSDHFMPYGVGERACPGQHFAKREIIAFCAKIVHDYDIEIIAHNRNFLNGPTFYGLGTQTPKSKIPFKIRLRRIRDDDESFTPEGRRPRGD